MKLIHRSIDHERVEWDRTNGRAQSLEVAFADSWEEENWPRPGLNHGKGTLQDLMFGHRDNLGHAEMRLVIGERDAMVAATAIQWLGTNCGREWLRQTVKRAGYLLLEPIEAAHYAALEEDMRKREQEVTRMTRRLVEDREGLEMELWQERNQIDQQRLALDSREQQVQRREATFWFLMMLANVRLFFRRGPAYDRARRQIAFADDDT